MPEPEPPLLSASCHGLWQHLQDGASGVQNVVKANGQGAGAGALQMGKAAGGQEGLYQPLLAILLLVVLSTGTQGSQILRLCWLWARSNLCGACLMLLTYSMVVLAPGLLSSSMGKGEVWVGWLLILHWDRRQVIHCFSSSLEL